MTELEMIAKTLMEHLDRAVRLVEDNKNDDDDRGELITPDKFSRGYALGYAHALSNAYSILPNWVTDKI